MTPAHFPILTIRPRCAGCPWQTKGPGCGFLDSGQPCVHPQERRRFTSELAPEREETVSRENQTDAHNVS